MASTLVYRQQSRYRSLATPVLRAAAVMTATAAVEYVELLKRSTGELQPALTATEYRRLAALTLGFEDVSL